MSFDELMTQLRDHFKPRLSIQRKHIVFDRLRQDHESVNEWCIKVKNTATHLGQYPMY